MVVKIMVPFWIPTTIRHLIFRVPKRDRNFDNHPNVHTFLGLPAGLGPPLEEGASQDLARTKWVLVSEFRA